MRIGMGLAYAQGGFRETVEKLVELEEVGLDAVSVAELYSFDAVSQLGYLAARTSRMHIESGIVQIYTRTPSLTAMTAAGLDYVSDGRFVLGMGASGPQVIEGFHGVKYDAPVGRTREIVEICRKVWRRERVEYAGKHYTIPLPADQGTGLGKPLKIINHPVREQIPIMLAALGPKNVEMAAELAEVWEPIWFHPGKAADVWGPSLAAGKAKRDPALGELQISVNVPFAVGPGAGKLREHVRPQLALYVGGMGAKDTNFYAQLAGRYGFADEASEIQDLYLSGRKEEAAEKVPEELVHAVSLIGTEDEVAAQVREFAAAGITQLNIAPLEPDHDTVKSSLETLKSLI
ncbi:LLM class F420-dependent oxidoreductase [Actinomycetospora lemnae]|uniref:LLM class F420-dependent oxidoreductase n=1 Tax=Actinomycetospora lemnae TaxID=3019891 RepID=A0ABT5SU80_9PSEU|nr:LLM class F420-dependent oxidoreductase [Actinomycetospora sp. DW7H6]MDD7966005.1 LLM class F420-dependent oxidoreductase [Actinomycetospora sp. DW7H6]